MGGWKTRFRRIGIVAGSIVWIGFVAGIISTPLFFSNYRVPQGSMYPAIKHGDCIFTRDLDFEVTIPVVGIELGKVRVTRGDIVVFPFPRDPKFDYVKRIVAMGGEEVFIENDQIFIDGKPLKEPYAYFDPQSRPDGDSLKSNFGPVKVPEGKLFMMGDNRYNSHDSRYWGFVEKPSLKSKGLFIYFSRDQNGEGLESLRLERIGKGLQ